MNRKLAFILFAFGFLALSVSSCAKACPPACAGAELSGLDWRDKDLSGAGLTSATARQTLFGYSDLNYADLIGIDMYGGDLSNADLTGARVIGADLREVTFSGATLVNIDLNSSLLTKADLTGVSFNGANLINADFGEAILVGANLFGQNLSGTDLTGAVLVGAVLRDANLNGSVLDAVKMSGAELDHAQIRGAWVNLADLKGASFANADLTGSQFIASNLSGCDLTGASLMGAVLTGANLKGADLRGADLRQVYISGKPEGVSPTDLVDPYFQGLSVTEWAKLDLSEASFDGAIYNDQTKFPTNFDQISRMVFQPGNPEKKEGADREARLIIGSEGSLSPLVNAFIQALHVANPAIETAHRNLNPNDDLITDTTEGIDLSIVRGTPVLYPAEPQAPANSALLGYGELVLITNNDDPISELTYAQFISLFSGLEPSAENSELVDRLVFIQNTPLLNAFLRDAFPNYDLDNDPRSIPTASDIAARSDVSGSDHTFALIPKVFADDSVKQVRIQAGPAGSVDGLSRMYYPIYAIFDKDSLAIQTFTTLALSDEASAILTKYGYIPSLVTP